MQYPFTLVASTPENLDQATKNVIAASKKVGYNPKQHTNWMMLPSEMKQQVLEWMDLQSRTRLAATSKTEKKIVLKKKFVLNGLHVSTNGFDCRITGSSLVGDRLVRNEFRLNRSFFTGQFKGTMKQIFETCDVKCFFFYNWHPFKEYSSQGIAQLVPFRFERFICGENWEVNMFVLKNCVALKSVTIDAFRIGGRNPHSYEEVFQLPAIRGAEHMECANIEKAEIMLPTITTWLETRTPVGKSIELKWTFGGETLETFVNAFKEKIIQKSDNHLILRMSDPDRQLLFHRIHLGERITHILIKVIPRGLPESEYTTLPFNKWQYALPRFDVFRQFSGNHPHN